MNDNESLKHTPWGTPIPLGVHSEIPQENAVRRTAPPTGRFTEGVGAATRKPSPRRAFDAGLKTAPKKGRKPTEIAMRHGSATLERDVIHSLHLVRGAVGQAIRIVSRAY